MSRSSESLGVFTRNKQRSTILQWDCLTKRRKSGLKTLRVFGKIILDFIWEDWNRKSNRIKHSRAWNVSERKKIRHLMNKTHRILQRTLFQWTQKSEKIPTPNNVLGVWCNTLPKIDTHPPPPLLPIHLGGYLISADTVRIGKSLFEPVDIFAQTSDGGMRLHLWNSIQILIKRFKTAWLRTIDRPATSHFTQFGYFNINEKRNFVSKTCNRFTRWPR